MVDVAQIIPTNPEEQASVLAVLREHPQLREFIQRAIQKAEEIFPNPRVTLDAVRYEEYDPPVRLQFLVTEPLMSFDQHYSDYVKWLVQTSHVSKQLIQILPLWKRPTYPTRP